MAMPEERRTEACFRIEGPLGATAAERVRTRLAERRDRGVLSAAETERVSSAKLPVFPLDGPASEAFRRCCIAWEADRPVALTSHRPLVGGVIVAVKRAIGRLLRFQNEAFLARQREFNWNLLLVLRDLLERVERPRDRD